MAPIAAASSKTRNVRLDLSGIRRSFCVHPAKREVAEGRLKVGANHVGREALPATWDLKVALSVLLAFSQPRLAPTNAWRAQLALSNLTLEALHVSLATSIHLALRAHLGHGVSQTVDVGKGSCSGQAWDACRAQRGSSAKVAMDHRSRKLVTGFSLLMRFPGNTRRFAVGIPTNAQQALWLAVLKDERTKRAIIAWTGTI